MTGKPLADSSDGIWDDGEWISWEWINTQIEEQELRKAFPDANPDAVRIFQDLVSLAQHYEEVTGRYLQIWGELGELYAEIFYGLVRHKPGTQGSDGRIGNDWIEVKTISPEKQTNTVDVKLTGRNFNKLLVVRITEDFEFMARMIDRAHLGKKGGKNAKYKWGSDTGSSGASQ
jgi:hypothetical protein